MKNKMVNLHTAEKKNDLISEQVVLFVSRYLLVHRFDQLFKKTGCLWITKEPNQCIPLS